MKERREGGKGRKKGTRLLLESVVWGSDCLARSLAAPAR